MSYNSDIQGNNLQLQAILETIDSLPSQSDTPKILVTAPTGSTVTATQGGVAIQTTEESGVWTFHLPSFGLWTVTATNNGDSDSDTVDVQQNYPTTLSYNPTASLTPTSGVSYTNGIAALTAEQMNLFGEAISSNAAILPTTSVVYIDNGANSRKISVGDTISLTVSGASYEFIVLGFNHDALTTATAYGTATATGKAGFTLQMKNCLASKSGINTTGTNVGGWNSCAIRSTLQSTIKSSMDNSVKAVIKTVKKMTSSGNKSTAITTSNDTLFLLSEIETFGSTTFSSAGEGSQYAYYLAGNTKIKSVSGTKCEWWERSPWVGDTASFCIVTQAAAKNATSAAGVFGISFAICI